ncbi:hypothetical protein QQS21_001089 [Conoideocrella luteorostrata]|uniref:Class I glutamine amidotransferase-like protein n=1 Tax=Conoideocrella luteorostrata TaxID=1105319 RepID=A0AAJ0G286_9HYPO|nr:hypothetical protein QQS21_001089 [Conoideocrella luteorostrata]
MADYGHDPTETAVPFMAFKDAGFQVSIATEVGKSPKCDAKMLEGITQKLFGASRSVVSQYSAMSQSPEWTNPTSWSSPAFTLDDFDMVFLPGGHEKSVRQVIDASTVHKMLLDFFPKTRKPSNKAVGAVCHGVMVLSQAKGEGGKSVIHDAVTTTLPGRFEQVAFWGTRAFLGDYYKTYGAGSEDVETSVSVDVLREKKSCLNLPSSLKVWPPPFLIFSNVGIGDRYETHWMMRVFNSKAVSD